MIKPIDIQKAKNKKAVWDFFDWGYPVGGYKGFFRNNSSLNCGCQMCKSRTFYKRLKNKQNRLSVRLELKDEI